MTTLTKNTLKTFSLLFIFIFTCAQADEEQTCNCAPQQTEHAQLHKNVDAIPMDLVGELPPKLAWIIQQLNNPNGTPIRNRLLLYGPPGNGKTTLARACAQLTNSTFVSIAAPSLVNHYQGSGAEAISYAFYEAANAAQENGKHAIIFIDEIDAIAAVNNDKYVDHKAALQQLWLELDKHKNNPLIFVIVATNRYEQLDKAFIDRFGNNIIELPYPDATLRKKVLAYYFAKQKLNVDAHLQTKLAKKSDSLSIRCLEDLVNDIRMASDMNTTGKSLATIAWESLNVAKTKFKNNKSDQDAIERQEKRLNKIYTIMSMVSISVGFIFSAQQLKEMITQKGNNTQKTLNEHSSEIQALKLWKNSITKGPELNPQIN